jgi:acyl-CoA thioesterase
MENNTEKDKFARSIGVQVIEALPERAVCKLEINENHLNGLGLVNGGVLFTIADYAMAVAANANGSKTVTLNSTIDFIKSAKEGTLIAVAIPIKTGRTISRYKVEITLEETSQLIAVLNATSYTLG